MMIPVVTLSTAHSCDFFFFVDMKMYPRGCVKLCTEGKNSMKVSVTLSMLKIF